ncbi:unnamed protein product, partial [Symbiodinium sp. KB8]
VYDALEVFAGVASLSRLLLISILKAKDGNFVVSFGTVTLVRRHIDPQGKKRFTGKKDSLKASGQYPYPFGLRFVRAFPRLVAERVPARQQASHVLDNHDPKSVLCDKAARKHLQMLRVPRPKPSSPTKRTSPVEITTPVKKTSPVKKQKKRSPVKKTTPVKKSSPVKKTSQVKKTSPDKKTSTPSPSNSADLTNTATPSVKLEVPSPSSPVPESTTADPYEEVGSFDMDDDGLQQGLEAMKDVKTAPDENNGEGASIGNGKDCTKAWRRAEAKVLKYCMNPKRIKTHTRRDKYEKEKIEYWVEEETKGSYTISQKESWNDKREIDATEDLEDLGGPASACGGEDGSDDDQDDDDDDDDISSRSSGSSGSSTHVKKHKRAAKNNKKKKAKKDKKNKKEKKTRKEKKSKPVSSPSSKAGSPKKEQLEEEARTEAIENAGTLMQQLLRVQSKVEACAGQLESFDTINGYATKLSAYHDELADLKASYTASKQSICQKSVKKLQDIVIEAGCARFGMEETRLK